MELQMWRGYNDQVEIAGYNFEINWAKVIFIALAAVFLTGTLFGIALGLAVARLSAPKPSKVEAPVREVTATRSAHTMSPVTYKWRYITPRFQPLPDTSHGAWASNTDWHIG